MYRVWSRLQSPIRFIIIYQNHVIKLVTDPLNSYGKMKREQSGQTGDIGACMILIIRIKKRLKIGKI